MKPSLNKTTTSYPLIWLNETDSTNRYLSQLCDTSASPLTELTTVATDFQTAGKGQRGNSWESTRGENLLFSFVLYPTFLEANKQFSLSQLVALAIKEVLDNITPDISIKWSNDIYWKEKKICGILIEHDLQGGSLSRSIIGVGLNVNQQEFHSDAPNPVSLRQITGTPHQRHTLLTKIIERIRSCYTQLQCQTEGYRHTLNERYNNSLFRRNTWHTYTDNNGTFEACLLRTEIDGRLVLLDRNGTERKYWFKEIRFQI